MCLVQWTDLKRQVKQRKKNQMQPRVKVGGENAVYFGVTQGEEAQLK